VNVETSGGIVNGMSVDVEDHFHVSVFDGVVPRRQWEELESRVVANTERLLAMFDDARVRATFFVLGCVGERVPHLVRQIASAGHEVASHGYAHRLVYDQTPRDFRADVRRAKQVLEDACGVAVAGYRAPSYSITPRSLWALDILIEEGYGYDTSIFPIHHDRYGIPLSPRHAWCVRRPAGTLVELPASTLAFAGMNLPIGGGGYFRILPYGWTRFGIAHVNAVERRPVVFYLHPWEIDPGQPRLSVGWMGRFRHYRNLDKTEGRLEQLLRDFTFAPLRTVLPLIDLEPATAPALALPYVW
jgi:polysaccharide deacetylase family protein (PEP-CTERM system associated)